MIATKYPEIDKTNRGIIRANGYTVEFDDLVDSHYDYEVVAFFCDKHAKQFPKWKSRMDYEAGAPICGVKGCNRETVFYGLFKYNEVTPILPNAMPKYKPVSVPKPKKSAKLVISEVGSKRKTYGKKR